MTPAALAGLCIGACERWRRGEQVSEVPTVVLTVWRPKPPFGEQIRLFGSTGPLGRVCAAKKRDGGGYEMVGYFPAIPILRALGATEGLCRDLGRKP